MRARLLSLLLLLLPVAALAQGAATLVADSLEVTADERLIARGNVEVFHEGTRMSAAAIVYDRASDRLIIDGPILIVAPEGTILTAERADLDPRLENGLLRGARLVLDRQLQLAANRIDRVDGRLSALTRVAATSCQICEGGPPLWEIRAARVVNDEEARQLYFDNATFRVAGVPIAWVPRMRLPDPTLERATGLLVPGLRTTDQLGVGIRLPYFIRIGDSRDLTLTPYLSPATRTLEARYRQAFLTGDLEVRGAITRDDIRDGETRRYILAEGRFDLGRGFRLDLAAEATSDPAYPRDYGYSDADRLPSGLVLSRGRGDERLRADVTWFRTLREDEAQDSLPPFIGRLAWDRRLPDPVLGGVLTFSALAETFERPDDTPGDAGRDVTRLGLRTGWRSDWTLPGGVLAEARAAVELGLYDIGDDPDYAGPVTRLTPAAAVTLRWPLMREGAAGAVHLLEPAVTLAWSETTGGAVPNEDSSLVEFDEGNLHALTRFPGEDAREGGLRASLGVQWIRVAPGGWEAGLSFGRIHRQDGNDGFSSASGLDGLRSDWLVSGHLALPAGIRLDARSLLDDAFDPGKTEARLTWSAPAVDLAAAYVWLPAEPAERRGSAISEWTLDARWQIDERWSLSAEGRYDAVANQPVRAGLGVGWRNECVTVDLSVARSYTSSTVVDPVTDFGLTVNLTGFSAGRTAAGPAAGCRG